MKWFKTHVYIPSYENNSIDTIILQDDAAKKYVVRGSMQEMFPG